MVPNEKCGCDCYLRCSYWSLSCPNPEGQGDEDESERKIRYAARLKRAMQSQHRAERGLVDYHICDVKELRAFTESRGLASSSKRASKRKMIHVLQKADDQMVFDRFMDLPPELRVLIYNFLLDVLTKPRKNASQPPITMVSRLVRQETLPLFYHDMCIFVEFVQYSDMSGNTVEPTGTLHSTPYHKQLSAGVLGQAKTIELCYTNRPRQVMWTINLYPNEVTIEKTLSRHSVYNFEKTLAATFERHLSDLVTEIAARPTKYKLRATDFVRMERACEAAAMIHWVIVD